MTVSMSVVLIQTVRQNHFTMKVMFFVAVLALSTLCHARTGVDVSSVKMIYFIFRLVFIYYQFCKKKNSCTAFRRLSLLVGLTALRRLGERRHTFELSELRK